MLKRAMLAYLPQVSLLEIASKLGYIETVPNPHPHPLTLTLTLT